MASHIVPVSVVLAGLVIPIAFTVTSQSDIHSKLKLPQLRRGILPGPPSKRLIKDRFEDVDSSEDSEDSEDYEDYDDDIYDFAHLRYELYDYVNQELFSLKEKLLRESASTREKVATLEKQLEENAQNLQLLEMQLRLSIHPQTGDLRLINEESTQQNKEGILQFYSGSAWGFVCDDYFNHKSASVSCSQMGYSRNLANITFDTADVSSLSIDFLSNYNIMVDDVVCDGTETKLDSCRHLDIGEHDCGYYELVYLRC